MIIYYDWFNRALVFLKRTFKKHFGLFNQFVIR